MYDVVEDNRIFVYDFYTEEYIHEFENLDFCCKWILNNCCDKKELKNKNLKRLLWNIASNENEYYVKQDRIHFLKYGKVKSKFIDIPVNRYLIVDISNRIFSKSYLSVYILENLYIIQSLSTNNYSFKKWSNKLTENEKKWEMKENLWNDTKKRIYFKHPKSLQEKRYSVSEEHKYFIRGKRSFRNLPDSWDDNPVVKSISWKDNTKFRKPWLKNIK